MMNCTLPKPATYSRNHFRRTFGNRTNNMTGIAITANRIAARKNGGKWSSPSRIAMKFSPQRTTTNNARRRSRVDMAPSSAWMM